MRRVLLAPHASPMSCIAFVAFLALGGCASLRSMSACAKLQPECPAYAGGESYGRGQIYLRKAEYLDALAAFEEAARKSPKVAAYSEAVGQTKRQIVEDAMSRAGNLPEAAIPARLDILRTALSYDGSSPARIAPLIRSLEELQSTVTAEAAEIKDLAAREPVSALIRLVRVLEYEPHLSAVRSARESILAQRTLIIAHVTRLFDAQAFDKAKQTAKALAQVILDEEIRQLEARIDHAIEQRAYELREREAKRLVALGEQAYLAQSLGIALHYYTRAYTALPSLRDVLTRVTKVREELLTHTSKQVRLLFSDSLAREHRDALLRLASASLRDKRLPITLEELADVRQTEFVTEVDLVDFRWDSKVGEREPVWSSFLAGYQRVPNPHYTQALLDYQQAQREYTAFVMQNNPWGQLAASIGVAIARRKLEQTPQFLEEPLYQTYQYTRRLVQERGQIAIKVSLLDARAHRECASDTVIERDNHTVIEIAGAHPKDRGGATNLSYSVEQSAERREQMKGKAFQAAAEKIAAFAATAQRYRSEELFALGAVREGTEAALRYAIPVLSSSAIWTGDSSTLIEELHTQHLLNGLPDSGADRSAREWTSRSLPSKTLLARRRQPEIESVTVVASRELSAEEVVNLAKPAVVTIRTFVADGSGFFVDSRGLIITNAHVIENARDVGVSLADGRRFTATVVLSDSWRDIAVLLIEGGRFPVLAFRSGGEPAPGENVLAIGAARGLDHTVTRGVVSGHRRLGEIQETLSRDPDLRLIQTDAAINPGNSGGPLIDKFGRVIGMTTMKLRGEGLGFAIAASELVRVIERVRGEGK